MSHKNRIFFADGAVTGAYVTMFNHFAHHWRMNNLQRKAEKFFNELIQSQGDSQDPLMEQLNAHLEQYHLATLVGLEHAPTFHIDRDGQYTSINNPGHTVYSGSITGGSSDVYMHPSAFEGQFKLFLVTGHELIHVSDLSNGSFERWINTYRYIPNAANNIAEYRAYKWQAHQESILGVNYGAASQLAKYRNLLPAGYLGK